MSIKEVSINYIARCKVSAEDRKGKTIFFASSKDILRLCFLGLVFCKSVRIKKGKIYWLNPADWE